MRIRKAVRVARLRKYARAFSRANVGSKTSRKTTKAVHKRNTKSVKIFEKFTALAGKNIVRHQVQNFEGYDESRLVVEDPTIGEVLKIRPMIKTTGSIEYFLAVNEFFRSLGDSLREQESIERDQIVVVGNSLNLTSIPTVKEGLYRLEGIDSPVSLYKQHQAHNLPWSVKCGHRLSSDIVFDRCPSLGLELMNQQNQTTPVPAIINLSYEKVFENVTRRTFRNVVERAFIGELDEKTVVAAIRETIRQFKAEMGPCLGRMGLQTGEQGEVIDEVLDGLFDVEASVDWLMRDSKRRVAQHPLIKLGSNSL